MSQSFTHSKLLLVSVSILCLPALIPWQAVAQETRTKLPSNERLDSLAKAYLFLGVEGDEYKLTSEQKEKLNRQMDRANREVRDFGQKLEDMKTAGISNKERFAYDQRIRMPMFKRHHEERWAILTRAQQDRQKQLVLQFLGPLVLGNKTIAQLVRLSSDQSRAIAAFDLEYRKFMRKQSDLDMINFDKMLGLKEIKIRDFTAKEKSRLAQIQKELFNASGKYRTQLKSEYNQIHSRGFRYEGRLTDPKPKDFASRRSMMAKELMAARRKELARLSDKALGLLTPVQKKRWQEIQGRPAGFIQAEAGGDIVFSYR